MSPRGCTLVTELPEIMINIFQYLNDAELDACSQVCTLWKDIIEHILFHRVIMITRKIPLIAINSVVCESEKLRPYFGFDEHFQYNWFVFGDEPERKIHSTYNRNESVESMYTRDSSSSRKYMEFTHALCSK
ncbi:uncharacterized protein LOC111632422 [Centruroides sculpturatus]|uniref:uncharacterized protein LOC111632422 n=1 Tax=Centruroides sculpturatus TaxID=218467 RepID=UPI000C6CDD6B|nr:uncharacterized protein LOC111632422 [Centruroides sculpturatus]